MLDDLRGKRALITEVIDRYRRGRGQGNSRGWAWPLPCTATRMPRRRKPWRPKSVTSAARRWWCSGDVSKSGEADRIVAEAVAGLGGLDILVNNAGAILDRVTNAAFDEATHERVYNLNVRSVLAVTKAAYPHLKAAGGGAVINTGSVAGRFARLWWFGGHMPRPRRRCIRSPAQRGARVRARHIRVNVAAPGFIITPFRRPRPRRRWWRRRRHRSR